MQKIKLWLMGRKKFHYLHVSYKVHFDEYTGLESDRFFRLEDCSLKKLRQSIINTVEKESDKKVNSLMLVNITELSKDLFDMLMKSETFEGI